MVPYKTGGLTRAIGTKYVASAKLKNTVGHNYCANLLKFIFDPNVTFALEFGHEYIRFYSNEQQVTINSAPLWITGTTYAQGAFVEDPGDGNNIYYAILPGTSTTQPHAAPSQWVKQNIYEVPSPYSADAGPSGSIFDTDVFQIQPCQINDIIYIVHPEYPPYKLSRFGDTDWTMQEVEFLTPALLDQNSSDITLTPNALIGNGILVQANAPAWVASQFYTLANSVEVSGIIYNCIVTNVSGSTFAADYALGYWQKVGIFNPQHDGSTWQYSVLRQSASVQIVGDVNLGFPLADPNAIQESDPLQILGNYEVHTYGVWSATIQILRSLDGGITYDTVYNFTGLSDRNADIQGNAPQLGIYKIAISNNSAPTNPGATAPRVVLEADNGFLSGLFEITNVGIADASAMINGDVYQILTLGTTNWSALGAGNNAFVGEIFVYNGSAVTGSGGQVTNPYLAQANVVTQLSDSNPLSPAWVNGTSYTASQNVSYNFINYEAINNVPSDGVPPPQDPTNWGTVQPGGSEYWAEGAWSEYRGYPQAITSFQQRMWYAASGFQPQRIWGTVTNDIENFALGDQTLATDGLAFDLNAPTRGSILWLTAQSDLFAGLMGAEWVINSGSVNSSGGGTGSAITPSALNAVEQGTYGSAPFVIPAIVGNAVFFVQRQADAIRQMFFSVYTAKYMSSDLTTQADHLFSSGIVKIDYQTRWRHQGMLWALTQQGSLCGLTYDLDQEVFGWCRRLTGTGQFAAPGVPLLNDNGFESLAIIPGTNNSDDQVWVVANRLINGVQTRYIELVNPNNWEETFSGAPNPPAPSLADAYYLDSGTTIASPGSLTLTAALPWLPGRYVYGLADGNGFGPLLVGNDGTIILPNNIPTTVTKVQVGLPILYYGQPMRFDSSMTAGNLQARTKQVADWYVRLWNSSGGLLSNGTTTYPYWVASTAYVPGNCVISDQTQGAFMCVIAYSGIVDPSLEPTSWISIPVPSYQAPQAIPYTKNANYPFAIPTFVASPTDFRLPTALQPSPDHDPKVILTGNDALPLTVLGLFVKMDLISQP